MFTGVYLHSLRYSISIVVVVPLLFVTTILSGEPKEEASDVCPVAVLVVV